jgi:glycosyltransferase involved in cell wall biosynthesis
MKISVITINYNNKKGLVKTIESICSQSTKLFEYIIVDGNSNDGSVEVISENNQFISKWVSEPDKGIYNAMNKAVRIATGDYCVFMNSGDVFYSETIIEQLFNLNFSEDFVLGAVLSSNGGLIKAKKKLSMADFVCGSIAHQASLIKRSLLLNCPYDEELRIVADWKFCIQTLIFSDCTYKSIDIVIAKEEPNGISTGLNEKHSNERLLVLRSFLPKKVLDDYVLISKLRKKPFKWLINFLLGNE